MKKNHFELKNYVMATGVFILAEVCRFRQWQLVQIWHLYPCIKAAEA